MNKKTNLLVGAAVLGIMSAASMPQTFAADKAPTGKCVGANACGGKGACKQEGANECAGKNGCKGKGFLKTSEKKCEQKAKKDSKIHWEAISS